MLIKNRLKLFIESYFHYKNPILHNNQLLSNLEKKLAVSRISYLTPLDKINVPVINLCLPNRARESFCAGKGHTIEQALISSFMEGVEYRVCDGKHLTFLKGLTNLQMLGLKKNVIKLDDMHAPHLKELSLTKKYDWVECIELSSFKKVWLPKEIMTVTDHLPNKNALNKFPSTNGMASGLHPVDAILHGLLELVERDAFCISNFTSPKKIEIKSIDLKLKKLVTKIQQKGIEVLIFDITSDLDIPTLEVYLIEQMTPEKFAIHQGQASHFNISIALDKALLEATQVRLTYFAGAREDTSEGLNSLEDYNCLKSLHKTAHIKKFKSEFNKKNNVYFLQHLIKKLSAKKMKNIFILNNSNENYGVFSCACFVPGLEGPNYDSQGNLIVGDRGQSFLMTPTSNNFN